MIHTNILVAFATKNGSTAGIAGMIAAALREDGCAVDVLPASEVRDVGAYDAVILGSALYSRHWHPAARRFARRFSRALSATPVWLFSSGPLNDSADATEIPPVPQAVKAMQQLGAGGHVTFGGRLTDQAKGFVARSMVRNGRGGDFRNPQRIAQWAHSIAVQVGQTVGA